jgi:hypothetical protein
MTGFFRFLLVSLAFTLGTTNLTHAASFDCSKATTETERAICNDPELSALDDMMEIIWINYLVNLGEILPIDDGTITDHPLNSPQTAKEEHRSWIRETNACAGKLDCLEESYRNRIRSISKSTFTGHGGNRNEYIRLYFQRLNDDCQRPSKVSVDQFYDESRQLCYELIPNTRWVSFFAAGGVMLIEYYELAPGYFDCYGYDLLQMKIITEGAASRDGWVTKYRYNEYFDEAEGKREVYTNGGEVSLVINLKEGLEFDKYYFGCGMKNVDLSGGSGFGGKN